MIHNTDDAVNLNNFQVTHFGFGLMCLQSVEKMINIDEVK